MALNLLLNVLKVRKGGGHNWWVLLTHYFDEDGEFCPAWDSQLVTEAWVQVS